MFEEHVAETWEHAGCTIKIVYDLDPIDPRKDYDHQTVMFCDHRRYTLGDEDTGIDTSGCNSWQDVLRCLITEHQAFIYLPLYLLDHSGITMRTGDFNDPWDSGQVGFIFHTEKSLREQFCLSPTELITDEIKANAKEGLKAEVTEYASYLEGDCVGWVVENTDGEIVESCWGYLDYFSQKDYIKSEANAVAESEQQRQIEANGAALMQKSITEVMA